MDHQNNPNAVSVARARALLAAATIGVERLESAAHQASRRLAALTEKMAQLEGRGGSPEPEVGEAAALGAAVGKEIGPEQADSTATAQATSSIEEHARQRMRQGLAPPREIYDIRNRDRVDWSTLPEWAMPPDPDLFEGCAHEG
jgi:hypothetical protein